MLKLFLAPIMLGVAVILSGLYGGLHNQLSYSVGPTYFHDFKFAQFGIEPALHNRIGAALVGIRASWWMGLLLGMPLLVISLFVRGAGRFVRVFLTGVLMAVGIAILVGLGGLAVGMATVDSVTLPDAMRTRATSDPVGFAHAGIMHDASYLGGLIGAVCAGVYAGIAAVRSRAAPAE